MGQKFLQKNAINDHGYGNLVCIGKNQRQITTCQWTEEQREQYFTWLVEQHTDLCDVRVRGDSYWNLSRILFTSEFVPLIRMDENRIGDALMIQRGFVEDMLGLEWLDPGRASCNVLELIIGISKRIAHELFHSEFELNAFEAVFEMFCNLRIDEFSDNIFVENHFTPRALERKIRRRIDKFVAREFDNKGIGGLFPVSRARKDQRDVEIWYQMSSWICERLGIPY